MTDSTKTGPPEEKISYEQARDELIAVVQKLETGGTTLEESLALWEQGEKLARICQEWLDGARARLAAASQQPEGGAPTENAEDRASTEN